MSSKRVKLVAVAATAFAVSAAAVAALNNPRAGSEEIVVYKSPTCGCCSKWVGHLESHGFMVVAHDVTNLAEIKAQFGVSSDLTSCHTAAVDGYVIEGHVPADVIARLLDQRPDVLGLAVPGMPMGSPGMEGSTVQRYDVIAFGRDGSRDVYERR